MARIRPIKPDLPRSRKIYEAEIRTGLPIRFAVVGLIMVADREGRFEWRPWQLKLDCLPYDDLEFGLILDELVKCGTIIRYEIGTDSFGYFPNWHEHQRPRSDEAQSRIPAPLAGSIHDVDDNSSRGRNEVVTNSRKGREGKGRERKGEEDTEGNTENHRKTARQTPHQMIQDMAYTRDATDELLDRFGHPPWTPDQITEAKAWLLTLPKYTEAEMDSRRLSKRRKTEAGVGYPEDVIVDLKRNWGVS